MRLSVVFSCVRVLAETVAQLPLHVYRRLPNGGKERAVDHALYRLLHVRPNAWQTSFEWREMMEGHVALRGNAFSEIIRNSRGEITALIPLHPDRVSIEQFGERGFRWVVRNRSGGERRLPAGAMFHLRGLSSDGFIGINPIEQEREAVGLTLAAQEYGARFYQNGAMPGGWIEFPGHFKDREAREEFRESWQTAQAGMNRHKTAVLERGMKYHELGIKHTDAQFLETRKYQDTDIARIFRMPPHKVGILDKATFSNIEQQSIEFVVDTMMPWLVRWEQAILRDLITDEETYFAEFSVDGLLRGDAKARGEFYQSGITGGWMTRNEARIKENLNPLPGLDEPLEPLNMAPAGQRDSSGQRTAMLASVAADRIVRKEVSAMKRAYTDCLSTPDGQEKMRNKILQFFGTRHSQYVSEILAVPETVATRYVKDARRQLLAALDREIETKTQAVLQLLDEWESSKAGELAGIGDEP